MSPAKVVLASLSAAMDGGFTAIADVSRAMASAGPGLAEALRRPGIKVGAEFQLTDGAQLDTTVVLPDAIGTLAMKALVRAVRTEWRDAEDLWRCLEIAAAEDVEPSDFDDSATLRDLRLVLWRELGVGGSVVTALTERLQDDAAARLVRSMGPWTMRSNC